MEENPIEMAGTSFLTLGAVWILRGHAGMVFLEYKGKLMQSWIALQGKCYRPSLT